MHAESEPNKQQTWMLTQIQYKLKPKVENESGELHGMNEVNDKKI